MSRITTILPALVLIFELLACDQIKNKTDEVTHKVKEKTRKEIKEQTQKAIDKVFPPFDHSRSDTKNNKQRFKDFVKVEITADVYNIYCFDDAIGIDASYMFSFNCDSSTSRKIIEIHNLTIDTINTDNGFGLQHDFDWWDKKSIARLQKYSWTDGNQYFKYYWYDEKEKKAYFFDFDM